MELKEEIFAILNKHNLTREAKEQVADIIVSEKRAILEAIEKQENSVLALEDLVYSNGVTFEKNRRYQCIGQDQYYVYLLHDNGNDYDFEYDYLEGKIQRG